MRKQFRPAITAVIALSSVLAIAACGSSSTTTSNERQWDERSRRPDNKQERRHRDPADGHRAAVA